MATLTVGDLPVDPGVYALYRDGDRKYVGKADSLRDRVWKNHSGRGQLMTTSAMRRNCRCRSTSGQAASTPPSLLLPMPVAPARSEAAEVTRPARWPPTLGAWELLRPQSCCPGGRTVRSVPWELVRGPKGGRWPR